MLDTSLLEMMSIIDKALSYSTSQSYIDDLLLAVSTIITKHPLQRQKVMEPSRLTFYIPLPASPNETAKHEALK